MFLHFLYVWENEMKLLYFLSLGLLLSLNSLTQADTIDLVTAEPKTELQGEQKPLKKNKQKRDKHKKQQTEQVVAIQINVPEEDVTLQITEPEAIAIQITEQSKEALISKMKKEKELSLCCAVKGGLSTVAALAALSAAVINAHDTRYGNVKLPVWDQTRVYGTSLALLYVSAQASRSAYNAFFKVR